MLLNQSVSDRAVFGLTDYTYQMPRLQTVVGLDVSIEPRFADAIAQVIVEIEPTKKTALDPVDAFNPDT